MSFQKQKVINLYKEMLQDCGEIKPYEWTRIRSPLYNEIVRCTKIPRPSVRRIINEYRKEIM